MSIRIALESPPEFYTNLDVVRGRVLISLSRNEQVGAIVVKLEGESNTALTPAASSNAGLPQRDRAAANDLEHENHKILYKVVQVFPNESVADAVGPLALAPGTHQFPFSFKIPFNNICGDPEAMSKISGIAWPAGFGTGPNLFGLSGVRVMDGSRQMLYSHVTKTLPPSFTGFPREAEVRYYIKVTVQRPGLFKENWRHQIGFKFLPIEPPRPPRTNQEAYARRPFTFRPRSPSGRPDDQRKRSSFFTGRRSASDSANGPSSPGSPGATGGPRAAVDAAMAPSIEMSARLPHPSILTCNQPIPLRLIAKKLNASAADVYLVSFQIELIGNTVVRAYQYYTTEVTRWIVTARHGLSIPVSTPDGARGSELVVPDTLWRDIPLPNTVMPSFVTCNLSRDYHLEVKIGLRWGKELAPSGKGKSRLNPAAIPQEIHLPLHFSAVKVFSGLAPPPHIAAAMRQDRRARRASRTQGNPQQQQQQPQPQGGAGPVGAPVAFPPAAQAAPRPPPRPVAPTTTHDPLYPPQLPPGDVPPYDDAPPSYDEAMAEGAGPVYADGAVRPPYSGQTNENGPSTIPEKG